MLWLQVSHNGSAVKKPNQNFLIIPLWNVVKKLKGTWKGNTPALLHVICHGKSFYLTLEPPFMHQLPFWKAQQNPGVYYWAIILRKLNEKLTMKAEMPTRQNTVLVVSVTCLNSFLIHLVWFYSACTNFFPMFFFEKEHKILPVTELPFTFCFHTYSIDTHTCIWKLQIKSNLIRVWWEIFKVWWN